MDIRDIAILRSFVIQTDVLTAGFLYLLGTGALEWRGAGHRVAQDRESIVTRALHAHVIPIRHIFLPIRHQQPLPVWTATYLDIIICGKNIVNYLREKNQ